MPADTGSDGRSPQKTKNTRSGFLQQLARRLSFEGWRRITNSALGCCFVAVIVPPLFARQFSVVGTIGAVVYGILMLVAYVSSYLEVVAGEAAQRKPADNGSSPESSPQGGNPSPQPG